MKNNLETYPQDGSWMSAYKWKEAFKKELQKTKAKELVPHECDEDACHYYSGVMDLIEKILGKRKTK